MIGRSVTSVTKALVTLGLVGGFILGAAACTREVEVTKAVPTVVVTEVPLSLGDLAQAIQDGEIDVGTEYGLAFDQRYHTIHVTALGLECAACHTGSPDTIQAVFEAQDVSPQAPGPVDRRGCLACHRAGPGHDLYGSGSP